MFARVLSMLAILAIAVVTTLGAAHAARMVGMQGNHAMFPIAMMEAATDSHPCCDDTRQHGSGHDGLCEFVCASLPAVLATPAGEAATAFAPARHDHPPEPIHLGHAPGLNERPPKLRLL